MVSVAIWTEEDCQDTNGGTSKRHARIMLAVPPDLTALSPDLLEQQHAR